LSDPKNVFPAPASVKAKADRGKQEDVDPEFEGLMSEIETDLRADEFKKIWTKYGTAIITLATLLIAGTTGFELYRQYAVKQHEATARRYELAVLAVESGKVDEAITEFGTIIDDKVEGYSALARLSQASLQVSKNDLDGAIANYKALAADKKADQVFRDVAVVLQVLHSLDREDPKTLEAVLTPLTNPSNAFNMSALELSALLAAKQGDTARAAKMLTEITADIAVPPSMRERAEDLAKLYQSGITPPPPSPASLAPVAPAPVPSAAAHAPAVAPAAKP
jgi:hypothetical protein